MKLLNYFNKLDIKMNNISQLILKKNFIKLKKRYLMILS